MYCFLLGTGIAPMRAFIQDIVHDDQRHNPIYLFFGCRLLAKDYIYETEWQALANKKKGPGLVLDEKASSSNGPCVDFTSIARGSRDSLGRKCYLQDIIRAHAARISDLVVKHAATVYLCGNTKLPKEVREALLDMLCNEQNMDFEQATRYLKVMESGKRFQIETW